MAMFNMYKNFEYLCPDAPDTISQLLLTGEYSLVRPCTVLTRNHRDALRPRCRRVHAAHI